jgi:hypothetical protein
MQFSFFPISGLVRVWAVFLCSIMATFLSFAALGSPSVEKFGMSFPAQVEVPGAAGTQYTLNGVGLRKKLMFQVYAAALYLVKKSSNPEEIVSSLENKYLEMHFLRKVDAEAVKKALSEGFEKGCTSNCASHKPALAELEKTLLGLGDFQKKSKLSFLFSADGTLKLFLNEKPQGSFGTNQFSQEFLKVFLGSNPPSKELKEGMLGL